MIENQRNTCRFFYLDNAIFQLYKMKLVQVHSAANVTMDTKKSVTNVLTRTNVNLILISAMKMLVAQTPMAVMSALVGMDTLVMAEVALTSTNVQLGIIIVTSTRPNAPILLVPLVVNVSQDMLVMVGTAVMLMNARKSHVIPTKFVLITLDHINVCASQVMKVKTAEISMNAT